MDDKELADYLTNQSLDNLNKIKCFVEELIIIRTVEGIMKEANKL